MALSVKLISYGLYQIFIFINVAIISCSAINAIKKIQREMSPLNNVPILHWSVASDHWVGISCLKFHTHHIVSFDCILPGCSMSHQHSGRMEFNQRWSTSPYVHISTTNYTPFYLLPLRWPAFRHFLGRCWTKLSQWQAFMKTHTIISQEAFKNYP